MRVLEGKWGASQARERAGSLIQVSGCACRHGCGQPPEPILPDLALALKVSTEGILGVELLDCGFAGRSAATSFACPFFGALSIAYC
jgi:hypothetical protein